jgi:hypothetical protein
MSSHASSPYKAAAGRVTGQVNENHR